MNNEIGRKLTSLTLMTIMFAGGMAIGVPSFMPSAEAEGFELTDGMLTVSSEYIQGGAILEVVVSDPTYSATDVDINSGPEITFGGTDYILTQAVDGKWYGYFNDFSSADALDDATSTGFEFGIACAGLGVGGGKDSLSAAAAFDIIGTGTTVWAEAMKSAVATADINAGDCDDIDGAIDNKDVSSSSDSRERLTDAVLKNAPAFSQWDTTNNADGGQRLHILNGTSGSGSWPFIFTFEFSDDNIIEYLPSGDMVNVEFGNTDDETAIHLINENPSEFHQIHLAITDPGLNIDPTSADIWIFDLDAASTAPGTIFANNGTNTALTATQLQAAGFVDNAQLKTLDLDGDGSNDVGVISGADDVTMTESTANSAYFESFDLNGSSQITVTEGAAADTPIQFSFGDNNVTMVITYHDATMTIENPNGSGNWAPATPALVTITDPDMNLNPGDDETMNISDETEKIPTIKIGSPLTLDSVTAADGFPLNETASIDSETECIAVCMGGGTGQNAYTGHVRNVSDHSERLRIITSGIAGGTGDNTAQGSSTWLNITTSWTAKQISTLEGTVILNYNIEGLTAGMTGVSDIDVYLLSTGTNSSNTSTNVITLQGGTSAGDGGVSGSGSLNLCTGGTTFVCSDAVTDKKHAWHNNAANINGNDNVTVAFQVTHASTGMTAASSDFAVAVDICNFDQDNASDTHNCIYRMEVEETGDNTGVFEGTVEYVQLVNASALNGASHAGVHAGNDFAVEGLIEVDDMDLTVVLMDALEGSDAIRVSHNDTDALQAGEEVQVQLDAFTHTGTVEFDATNYEVDDMATITIVDPDLNQDSEVRETYQNSSTTFQVNFTDATGASSNTIGSAQTIIETGPSTGVFVGTFSVPNELGEDMEITYFESGDVSGEAIEFYYSASISSNDGDVSFDQSVYPVPFGAGDLFMGSDSAQTTGAKQSGNVTGTIVVTESDNTTDTLTTSASGTAGTILVKIIQGTTTATAFTAGSAASADASTLVPQELGPLVETERGSFVYEVDFVVDEYQIGTSGANADNEHIEIKSGDVLQVEYVDTTDAGGATSTFYDSSTFDLRTGTLSVDKDVYVIGSDFVVTLTDPDLNVDGTEIQTYNLNLIEWDSEADSSELINHTSSTAGTDGSYDNDNFVANPSVLQETGVDTGVFQTVLTIPTGIYNNGDTSNTIVAFDFGEAVILTYVDTGLSGEDRYQDDRLDVEAYFSLSNFGALIELNKAVYNWTDTVYVSITAPDHNQDSVAEETIGTSALPIQVTTRSGKMCSTGDKTYVGTETDEDTGVFESEIQLIGFSHQLSSDSSATGPFYSGATKCGSGDDDGEIATASQTDGVSVSYEYNDNTVVVASASIIWNIGETTFDSSSVSAGGSGVVTVVDPDENINDSLIDTFTVDVFSDSDAGGFQLTMNETDEDTGVFEGTVFFTSDLATSGNNLRVSEGDTVTAEYVDETLPEPYTTDDDLTIAATTTVGTAFPPLERAPAANARVVDAFGASVAEVSVDQQVQIAADVSNGQSKDQAFAYLVQVQDGSGVTVSLAWITGSLTAGQSMSPALSWTPSDSGSYTATVFVWESVDNPTALSPTVSVEIDVV